MPFGIVGSLLGGVLKSGAASDAASTAAKADKAAANAMLPFLNTGTTAESVVGTDYGLLPGGGYDPTAQFLQPISSTIGAPPSPNDPSLRTSFQASPGYNYLLQQGADSVQNSAAGRTGAVSGNMLKGLQTNATGLASQDWGNYYQQLVDNYNARYKDAYNTRTDTTNTYLNLAGLGAKSGTTYGNQIANAGSATAAGTVASTNALTSPLSNSGNYNSLLSLLGYGGGTAGYGGAASGGGGGVTPL